jgi:hypothetical protein
MITYLELWITDNVSVRLVSHTGLGGRLPSSQIETSSILYFNNQVLRDFFYHPVWVVI